MRRVLLVTATPARRRLWEERLRDSDTLFRNCPGPNAACPLLAGSPCPLIEECDAAVYDSDVVVPDLLVALLSAPPHATIEFVASGPSGPRTTHVLADGVIRPAALASGAP